MNEGRTAPQTDLERRVRTAIARVARAPAVDDGAGLVDIGIDSLAFIRLVIELERSCQVSFDDEDIDAVKFGTVDDVIGYVLRKAAAPAAPAPAQP